MIDANLIYLKFLATSNATDNSLSVNDKDQIVPKLGTQKGDDLIKVICAVQEAVAAAKELDLKVTRIDLNGIEKNLKKRVDEFKENQKEDLQKYGYQPTQDKKLESALQALTTLIAQKQIATDPKPIVQEKPPLAPQKPISEKPLHSE